MKFNYKSIFRDKFKLQSIVIVSTSLITILGFLLGRVSTGDADIYLVFAQSMWEKGLFYYELQGPKGGATSPLWAFILSLFYLIDPNPLLPIRSLVFLLYIFTGATIFMLSNKMVNKLNIAVMSTMIWFLIPMGWFYASVPYETILGTLIISLIIITVYDIYNKIRNEESVPLFLTTQMGILSGVLLITRPDGAILIGLFYVYLFRK